MANRNYTPVMFGLEKNIVHLFAKVTWGATGVPTLVATDSKGICSIKPETVGFTGWVTNSSTAVSSVSTLAGIYPGMTLSGTGLAASQVISSSGVGAGVITCTLENITTTATGYSQALVATGGRFRIQFGSKEAQNLDVYNKLLDVQVSRHMTASSASGAVLVAPLAPSATQCFVVSDKTNTKTTTRSSTSGSQDASIVVQVGNGWNTNFSVVQPTAGEVWKFHFVFCNSTAM